MWYRATSRHPTPHEIPATRVESDGRASQIVHAFVQLLLLHVAVSPLSAPRGGCGLNRMPKHIGDIVTNASGKQHFGVPPAYAILAL